MISRPALHGVLAALALAWTLHFLAVIAQADNHTDTAAEWTTHVLGPTITPAAAILAVALLDTACAMLARIVVLLGPLDDDDL